jgi:hypothetical protein
MFFASRSGNEYGGKPCDGHFPTLLASLPTRLVTCIVVDDLAELKPASPLPFSLGLHMRVASAQNPFCEYQGMPVQTKGNKCSARRDRMDVYTYTYSICVWRPMQIMRWWANMRANLRSAIRHGMRVVWAWRFVRCTRAFRPFIYTVQFHLYRTRFVTHESR